MSGSVSSSPSGNGLRGATAFFLWELRRGAAVAAVGFTSVAIVALAQRLGVGDWVEPSVDWRTAAAVFTLFVMTPVLGLYLAAQWLRERRDGTLRWLYARPLAGGLLFALRLAAMLASLVLFAVCALVLLGVGPWDAVTDAAEGSALLFRGGLLLLCLGLPAGLFAAATSPSGGKAGAVFLAAVAAAFLLAAVPQRLLPVAVDLLADPAVVVRRRDLLLFAAFPLALLAGAAAAVWRAVEDRRALRRGALAAAVLAALSWAAVVGATLLTTWARPLEAVEVRSLGDGAVLRLLSGRGVHPDAAWAEVVTADGDVHRLRDGLFSGQPIVDRTLGRAMMLRAKDLGGWVLLDRGGGVRALPSMPFALALNALGWSPDGRTFAFRCGQPRFHGRELTARAAAWFASGRAREGAPACVRPDEPPSLLLVDGDTAEMQVLPFPALRQADRLWEAVWLDDDRFLVTVRPVPPSGVAGRWFVADRRGADDVVVHDVEPAGAWLQPITAAPLAGELEGLPTVLLPPSPLRAGKLLLWRNRATGRDLVTFAPVAAPAAASEVAASEAAASEAAEPTAWRLDTLAVRPRQGARWWSQITTYNLGTLADGTAVWLERTDDGVQVAVLPAGGGEVRVACRFTAQTAGPLPGAFRGTVGRRAFWDGGGEEVAEPLLACDLDGNRADVLRDLGPRGGLSADVLAAGLLTPNGKEKGR